MMTYYVHIFALCEETPTGEIAIVGYSRTISEDEDPWTTIVFGDTHLRTKALRATTASEAWEEGMRVAKQSPIGSGRPPP
jgi:hypothetical protein